jgi:hypothetical protein
MQLTRDLQQQAQLTDQPARPRRQISMVLLGEPENLHRDAHEVQQELDALDDIPEDEAY